VLFQVSRTDGASRRVLIWEDLTKPSSIALNPSDGLMYWSSWGPVPLIEQAGMDGGNRQIFTSQVGRANGLTIDYDTQRLYWTDLDGMSISYAYLKRASSTKVVIENSPRPYGLTVFRNDVYWADWDQGTIEKADKDTGENNRSCQLRPVGEMLGPLRMYLWF
jgi:low density lipoprotein receptor-related protein 5/6